MLEKADKVTGELVETGSGEKQPIILAQGLLTDDVIRQAEMQVEGIKKVKILSLRVTNKLDWITQDGKPYLQCSGAMKIRQLWGISIKDQKIARGEETDDDGKYIFFTVSGKAVWKGIEISDIGTCSTRDKLFGRKGGKNKHLEEIDLMNVQKKAVTNLHNRILKKILGLNPTWEDLKEAGIDISNAPEVRYAGGGAGGGKISEPQRKRLFAIAKKSGKGEPEIKDYIETHYKITSTADIDRKNYEAICEWAEKPKIELGG